jgi:glycosyltransferase involved in cell wall biosynthesis
VVSTSIGAEGLDVKDGVNIFIEDDVESFALRIVELLQNKNLSAAMGKAARELATSTYDWSQIAHKLEYALNCLLSERFVVNSVLNR